MIGLYTHATGCFVRDSVDPDYIAVFPFYSTEHCLGYMSWRFTIWAGILVRDLVQPLLLALLVPSASGPSRICS
jgi:hypothetical protein